MSAASSAMVVRNIWEAFARRFEEQFEATVSKKAASANFLEGDSDLLGRWTSPGRHKNWRIPLWRIDEFCEAFQATPEHRDELMMARLLELRDDNDGRPTSEWVAAEWGAQLAAPERLTADERLVLAAWRKQADKWARGLYGAPEENAFLERAFDEVLREAERLATEEEHGATLPPHEDERLRRQRQNLAVAMQRKGEEAAQERREARKRLPKASYRDKYLKQLLRPTAKRTAS